MEKILNTAIVCAAGSGIRMGSSVKKQWLPLKGIPIIIHTLKKFFSSSIIQNIIIPAPEEDLDFCQELIAKYFHDSDKPWLVIPGGMERQDSIFAALQYCPPETNLVFIHDAVRPFITEELLDELYEIARTERAVVPVARIKNTVKMIAEDYIIKTVPRENLVQALTPQVFSYELIMSAYEKAYEDGYISTDDSALVEYYGAKVRYQFCSEINLKITDELDLLFAEWIIEHNLIQ
jgi:2-C-methyl-D-erythritol 4-phosphate cytidylyltransferase